MLEILFESGFMQRGQCGPWHGFYKFLYLVSNLMIFTAYMTVPIILLYARTHSAKKALREITPRDVIKARIVYAAFVLFCGFGHLFDGVLAFQYPYYHLFAVWHFFTAVVSWFAAFTTFRLRAKILVGI